MPGEIRRRDVGYATLVAMLTAATLSAGAVLYQLFEQIGHIHAGVPTSSVLPVAIDTAGFVIMFLLGAQLMTGYRLVRVKTAHFRPVHVRTAWAVVGLLAFHSSAAVFHTLQGIQVLPVVLDAIGLGLLGLVALQLASGYGQSRPRRSRARAVHATVALAIGLTIAGHAALAIVHTLTG